MKQIILFGILLLFVSAGKNSKPSFDIFIVQGKLRTEVSYDDPKTITLKRKPFTIEMHLKNLRGVYLSSSFNTIYYNTPMNERFKDWEEIGTKVMAEENFNPDRELYVDDENLHYWFYDPTMNWYRMDKKVIFQKDETITTYTVNSLFDGVSKSKIAMKKVQKPLYFVFFADNHEAGTDRKELERKKTTLIFE